MHRHLIAVAAVTAFAAPAAAASVFDGSWKGDMAASQLSKKPNIYALSGGKYSCSTCVPPVSVAADGKPHPVVGNPYYDKLTVTVVDAKTVKRVTTKGGKTMGETTSVVSADGKSLTSSYTDTTAVNGVPVTGTRKLTRAAAGPAGSHAIAGSWIDAGGESSDAGLSFTMALAGDTVKYSTPTGIAYAAKLGAPPSSVVGDPGWTKVAVTREDTRTLVETDYLNDKVIGVSRLTIAADGKTMMVDADDRLSGRKSKYVARKQ